MDSGEFYASLRQSEHVSQGYSSELSCETTAASYGELLFNYACWRVVSYIRLNTYTGYPNFKSAVNYSPSEWWSSDDWMLCPVVGLRNRTQYVKTSTVR
jgi:hypothetical protein